MVNIQITDDNGNILDEYDPTDHEYYEVRAPDGSLICELYPEHDG